MSLCFPVSVVRGSAAVAAAALRPRWSQYLAFPYRAAAAAVAPTDAATASDFAYLESISRWGTTGARSRAEAEAAALPRRAAAIASPFSASIVSAGSLELALVPRGLGHAPRSSLSWRWPWEESPGSEEEGGGVTEAAEEEERDVGEGRQSWAVWMSSTLKKRKAKMNKHKLRKRRKKLRRKTK